ncbi:AAA family ATPase [Pseudomonas sp. NY5710]|uniref:ATP-dependent nuclease n=1 Tax=Pseudomonas sp. NY5710 TaxID=2662033 RepID=UPI00156E04E5|nr:AAA family ATPase [Pseudomonas sp. NY5710]QKL02126.1 AAA family ATPase [Pseudomonas sp. NY5710]
MRVINLKIENFRGVKSADLWFEGHTLLVGGNNVGKSTICEALDLVLSPDRLSRFPPVQEFDFYNAEYLEADGATPIKIRVEVMLVDLSGEIERTCGAHTELWNVQEHRLLEPGEADMANPPEVVRCLRIETQAIYNPEEDEFEANTFFTYSPSLDEGELQPVRKPVKRLFGFLYLRTLRTGSRALSLERGSLLDLILRLQGVRTGLWEKSIKRLRELNPPIDSDATDLRPVLDSIEERLTQYISVGGAGQATQLFVSQLTREHLRKTMSFFLSITADQKPVPFQHVGTGTLNTLVLALLSFIAEVKKDNVIFAMEEPEIALPPHTQRRIAKYLLEETTQCFVTSHSPYVIERFDPSQIIILRRNGEATVESTTVSAGTTLKGKMYKRHARRGLAEAMLGPGVIVAEGITEHSALSAVAEKMEQADPERFALDLAGITIFPVEGDGSLPNFGAFFKALGLRTYAFYDFKPRKPEENQKFADAFDVPYEIPQPNIEQLLVEQTPVDHQWTFLCAIRASGDQGNLGIPAERPSDDGVRANMLKALKSNKGNGYAARLIDLCSIHELPPGITQFLTRVYNDFPKPGPVGVPGDNPPEEEGEEDEEDLVGAL